MSEGLLASIREELILSGSLNQELGYVQQNNKAFVIGMSVCILMCLRIDRVYAGEYDWTGEHGGSSNLTDFLTASEVSNHALSAR